jgi:hypothetical protein
MSEARSTPNDQPATRPQPQPQPHDVADWQALFQQWTAAGQGLLARIHALHQLTILNAMSGDDNVHLASYDAAVQTYLTQVDETWNATKQRYEAHRTAMAATESSAGNVGFVERLVSDPSCPPATVMFVGFSGAAAEPRHSRFYLDPSLTGYIEVPDSVVLHTQSMPASQAPLGARYVWVQREPEVVQQLRAALEAVTSAQREIWGEGGTAAADIASSVISPFPDFPTNGRKFSESDETPFSFNGDDVPLPAGWPQAGD